MSAVQTQHLSLDEQLDKKHHHEVDYYGGKMFEDNIPYYKSQDLDKRMVDLDSQLKELQSNDNNDIKPLDQENKQSLSQNTDDDEDFISATQVHHTDSDFMDMVEQRSEKLQESDDNKNLLLSEKKMIQKEQEKRQNKKHKHQLLEEALQKEKREKEKQQQNLQKQQEPRVQKEQSKIEIKKTVSEVQKSGPQQIQIDPSITKSTIDMGDGHSSEKLTQVTSVNLTQSNLVQKSPVSESQKSEQKQLMTQMPNVTFEYKLSLSSQQQKEKEIKEEKARQDAIQAAYIEWKDAQKAKESANSQLESKEVEDAYTHWITAKRDKDIVMQQMQKEALEIQIQEKERELQFQKQTLSKIEMLHLAANENKKAKQAQQQASKPKESNLPAKIPQPSPAAAKPVYKPPKQEQKSFKKQSALQKIQGLQPQENTNLLLGQKTESQPSNEIEIKSQDLAPKIEAENEKVSDIEQQPQQSLFQRVSSWIASIF